MPNTATRGSLESVVEFLRKPQNLLVVSHYNPDGDAVGSALSLSMVLEAMGHRVTCFNRDPIPELFHFLPGRQRWTQKLPEGAVYDATLIIDVFDMPRAGLDVFERSRLGKVCVVDHHVTDRDHGDLQYIDPSAAASGVLVYRFAQIAGVKINSEMAQNIYCCLMTDTGSFRYSSSTPEAFRIAGEMVALGVEPWEFARRVYESQPANRIYLLAQVLSTLEVSKGGQYAMVHVDYATMQKYHATSDITDGFINYPRSIVGVEVAIFLRQNADGSYKASLRSSGTVDVQAICERLGGGGHRNAAGCTLRGDYQSVRRQIVEATEVFCK